MSDSRVRELFSNAIDWIYEHTEGFGNDEFVRALRHIGMSEDEIYAVVSELLVKENNHESIQ